MPFVQEPWALLVLALSTAAFCMLGNWAGTLASSLLLLGALGCRIRREERAMIAAFGEAYREFARGRARLVPYVW